VADVSRLRWKEWKTAAAKRHNLRIRGISESEARKWAGVSRRYWRVAGSQILQVPCPTATGTTLAWRPWTRPGSVSTQRPDEPPDADPHVRWC